MATRFGLTWWGQRWIAALEALGAAWENRLPRGRTYARKGTVQDLDVRPGRVRAQVQGSRDLPYRVELRIPAFDDDTWAAITQALATEVRHAAALLDGRMPEDVDDVLATCGVSLFPGPGDLATTCSCPDWANPCKHVAAVHYVLAQAFDDDPFLLPELRGRDRDTLLADLRAARSGGDGAGDEDQEEHDAPVPLRELHARRLFDAPGPITEVALHPIEVRDPTAALRALGDPPPALAGALGAIEQAVTSAAHLAWAMLTSDAADESGEEPVEVA